MLKNPMRMLSTGAQHNFDDAVFLVAELLVHRRRIFQARRVSNDEARIDVAGFESAGARPAQLKRFRKIPPAVPNGGNARSE
jgi:hypothetical protein